MRGEPDSEPKNASRFDRPRTEGEAPPLHRPVGGTDPNHAEPDYDDARALPDYQDIENFDVDVESDSIGNRTGNYLFTIGKVNSGKSTLQNFLIYRLFKDERIDLEFTPKDGNHQKVAALNAWIRKIGAGYFPNRTQAGALREFDVRITQAKRKPFDFSFLEISGEDIETVSATADDPEPHLQEDLETFLRLKHGKKRFIFVSDSSRHLVKAGLAENFEEDQMFSAFVRYLLDHNGLGLKRI